MQLFGGEHWKALRQIKPHLMAKNRQRANTSAVCRLHPIINDSLHKIEIGTHNRHGVAREQRGAKQSYAKLAAYTLGDYRCRGKLCLWRPLVDFLTLPKPGHRCRCMAPRFVTMLMLFNYLHRWLIV